LKNRHYPMPAQLMKLSGLLVMAWKQVQSPIERGSKSDWWLRKAPETHKEQATQEIPLAGDTVGSQCSGKRDGPGAGRAFPCLIHCGTWQHPKHQEPQFPHPEGGVSLVRAVSVVYKLYITCHMLLIW
jgi:hypothetical protein